MATSTADAKAGKRDRFNKRRDLIIEKATQAFGRKAFHATTLDEIADELEVTKASLYYYFSTKEELLYAVLLTSIEEHLERLLEDRPHDPIVEDQADREGDGQVDQATDHPRPELVEVLRPGELVSFDHFEFGAECEPENHYAPSAAEHLEAERGLLRHAARAYPESVPTTAEWIGKGMALVSAERLADAERMLRHADRNLDFMEGERVTLPEAEKIVHEAEEKRLRRMRAKLSRAIADARREQEKPSD